jgi:hypothetical protein
MCDAALPFFVTVLARERERWKQYCIYDLVSRLLEEKGLMLYLGYISTISRLLSRRGFLLLNSRWLCCLDDEEEREREREMKLVEAVACVWIARYGKWKIRNI